MVYTYYDIQEFNKQTKELLQKRLIRSKCAKTSLAFMVSNHVKEKIGKARMVINYKKLMIMSYLMTIILLTKQLFSIEFKHPLGSREWIAKADTHK